MTFRLHFLTFLFALLVVADPHGCQNKAPASGPATNTSTATNKNMNTSGQEQKQVVREGAWGGQSIRLVVHADTVDVEFDCAHGKITAKFEIGSNGEFDLPGTFVRERGGPTRANETGTEEAARYSGRIDGEKMTLTVKLTKTDQPADTFTLTKGSSGRIRKCL